TQWKERTILISWASVKPELGPSRQGRGLLLEGSHNHHAAILVIRPHDDALRNEPFHTTFQRRAGLLTDRNTTRFYLIRKNHAIIVERTCLRGNAWKGRIG